MCMLHVCVLCDNVCKLCMCVLCVYCAYVRCVCAHTRTQMCTCRSLCACTERADTAAGMEKPFPDAGSPDPPQQRQTGESGVSLPF